MDDDGDDNDDNKRRTRNLSEKKRRDQFNMLVSELGTLVTSNNRKMDKSTVLKSTILFLKNHNKVTIRSRVYDVKEDWKPAFLTNDEFTYLVLEALEGFVMVFSVSGTICYVSESITSLLGHNAVDMVNKSIFDLTIEEDRPNLYNLLQSTATNMEQMSNSAKDHVSIRFQIHLRRRMPDTEDVTYDLVQFYGHFRPNRDQACEDRDTVCCQYDNETRFIFVCIGRLHTPQLIRNVSLLDSNRSEFSSRHSLEWKFLFLDHRAPPIIGYLPFEVLGTSGYDYYHFDDLEKVVTCHEALMQKGELTSCFYRFLTKGQEWIWLQTRFFITYHQWNSKPEFVVCTHRVVSYDDIANSTKQELEELDADVSESTVNQDINLKDTPSDCRLPAMSPSYMSEAASDAYANSYHPDSQRMGPPCKDAMPRGHSATLTRVPDRLPLKDPIPMLCCPRSTSLPITTSSSPEKPTLPVISHSNSTCPAVLPSNVAQPVISQSNITCPVVIPSNITQPVVSQSNIMQPVISQSNITCPVVVPSNITQPVISQSNITCPVVIPSNITQPVVSQSNIMQPVISQSNITCPVVVPSNITQPVISQSNITQPVISQSNITQPVISQSNITCPVVVPSNITQPVISQSNITQPVISQSNITCPVVVPLNITQPVISHSNIDQPVISQSNITQPVVSQSNITYPAVFPSNITYPAVFPSNIEQPVISHSNITYPAVFPSNIEQPVISHSNITYPAVFPSNIEQPVISHSNITYPAVFPSNIEQPVISHSNITYPAVFPSNIAQPVISHSNISQPVISHSNITQPLIPQSNITYPAIFPSNITQPLIPQSNITYPAIFPSNITQPLIPQSNITYPAIFPSNITQPLIPQSNITYPAIFPSNITQPLIPQSNITYPAIFPSNITQPLIPQSNITYPAIFPSNITQPVLSPVEIIPISIPPLYVPLPTISPSYTAETATDDFGNSFQLVSQNSLRTPSPDRLCLSLLDSDSIACQSYSQNDLRTPFSEGRLSLSPNLSNRSDSYVNIQSPLSVQDYNMLTASQYQPQLSPSNLSETFVNSETTQNRINGPLYPSSAFMPTCSKAACAGYENNCLCVQPASVESASAGSTTGTITTAATTGAAWAQVPTRYTCGSDTASQSRESLTSQGNTDRESNKPTETSLVPQHGISAQYLDPPTYDALVPLSTVPAVVTTDQAEIQEQLQRKHEELHQMIVRQQEELRLVKEQLLLARLGIIQPLIEGPNQYSTPEEMQNQQLLYMNAVPRAEITAYPHNVPLPLLPPLLPPLASYQQHQLHQPNQIHPPHPSLSPDTSEPHQHIPK